MPTAPDPTSLRGCLLFAGGPLLLLWGAAWVGVGLYQLGTPAPGISAWAAGTILCAGTALLVVGGRLLYRAAGSSTPPDATTTEAPTLSFDQVALEDGRTATVRIDARGLEVETFRVRAWTAGLAALGLGAYVSHTVGTLAGGPPSGAALWVGVAFGVFAHMFRRRRVRRYPFDTFSAVVVDDRVVTLHRRGGRQPRLALAVRSWHVTRLAEALSARVREPSDRSARHAAPTARNERAEVGRALAAVLPDRRDAASTCLGVAFVAISLLLGAFQATGFLGRSVLDPRWFAFGALLIWLQDAATQRLRQRESERVHGQAERALVVFARRRPGDLVALVAPWHRTVVLTRGGQLVLEHRHVDILEAGIVVGTACLGGWLVLGALTPLHAGVFLLLLLASGYPRRRGHPEPFHPDDVLSFVDAGGRATLTVRGDDGPREVTLRYPGNQGRGVAALVSELCPAAEVREPGWRGGR